MKFWTKLSGVPSWYLGTPHTNDIIGNDFAIEAWEHMQFGGVQFGELGFEHIHRDWPADTIGCSHGYGRVCYL